jgi:hypothetical protein
MVIQGINNQIVISKAHEVGTDQSRNLHQQSNAAVHMGQDQKKQVEHDLNSVLRLNKTEHKRVNVDEEKEKERQQQQKQRKKKRSLLGFEYFEESPPDDVNDTTVSSRRFNASI